MTLALVAEISIGLLVPNQPLLIDSVLHHAVYFHLMWDCILAERKAYLLLEHSVFIMDMWFVERCCCTKKTD